MLTNANPGARIIHKNGQRGIVKKIRGRVVTAYRAHSDWSKITTQMPSHVRFDMAVGMVGNWRLA